MTPSEKKILWLGVGLTAGGATLARLFPIVESRLHVLNADKYVDADPAGLARAAGASLNVYALASCMQSEEPTKLGRLSVGCAVRNYCLRHKTTPSRVLLRSVWRGRRQPSDGHFGSQEAPGKWAATSKPPTTETLALARKIWEEPRSVPDPTNGAELWDAPEAQNRMHAIDPVTYPKDAEDVAVDRIAAGGTEVRVPGVTRTRFWKFT